jgi:hypothetical protein
MFFSIISMGEEFEDNLTLPEEVEDKSVSVESISERSEKEKKVFEKQNQFEFKSKKLEPEKRKAIEKEEKRNKFVVWIIIGVVVLGLVGLSFLLL